MKPAKDSLLNRHVFSFNETRNDGEQLILETDIFAAGVGGGIYFSQSLTLNSYNNSASFNLGSLLHPQMLRKLAAQLEDAIDKAKHNANLEIGIDWETERATIAKEQQFEKQIETLCKHPLAEHVDGPAGQKFSPEPWYNPHGDTISCKTIDSAYFAARVDGDLDIYYTIEDKTPIGFLLRNVQQFLKATWVDDGDDFSRASDVSIAGLLLYASSGVKDKKLKSEYLKALEMAGSHSLPLNNFIMTNA